MIYQLYFSYNANDPSEEDAQTVKCQKLAEKFERAPPIGNRTRTFLSSNRTGHRLVPCMAVVSTDAHPTLLLIISNNFPGNSPEPMLFNAMWASIKNVGFEAEMRAELFMDYVTITDLVSNKETEGASQRRVSGNFSLI